ncbi:hypothetical protein AMTR_s00003p00252450 [Amborella trichopoda]|uniref:Uncharacterized protein n=1 Tax=Amborella trichopoda TaxID=13333 RepID=W1P6S9_AMBTC|nr:hypothetical protein AMTR_s00003p00252450 [Amborella trichopoda]
MDSKLKLRREQWEGRKAVSARADDGWVGPCSAPWLFDWLPHKKSVTSKGKEAVRTETYPSPLVALWEVGTTSQSTRVNRGSSVWNNTRRVIGGGKRERGWGVLNSV